MVRRDTLAAAMLSLALVAGACGGDGTGTTGGPTVRIVKPTGGAALTAGNVEVVIEVTGFSIVNKLGQPAVAGEGHVHYFIDVSPLPTEPGKPAITADERTYHATTGTTYTWTNVALGQHTFAVQLVRNDHTPLEPPVTASVSVPVREY